MWTVYEKSERDQKLVFGNCATDRSPKLTQTPLTYFTTFTNTFYFVTCLIENVHKVSTKAVFKYKTKNATKKLIIDLTEMCFT